MSTTNIFTDEREDDRRVYETLMNTGVLDLQILAMAYAFYKYSSPIHPDFADIDIEMKLYEIAANRLADKNPYVNTPAEYTKYSTEIEYLRKNFSYRYVSGFGIPAPRPPHNTWF